MANSIKIGGFSFDALKIGSSDVDAAYIGDTLVYSGGTPPTPTLQWATFSNGDTIPSDLQIYGIKGIVNDLYMVFGDYYDNILFELDKNNYNAIIGGYETVCYNEGGIISNTSVEYIFSNVGCSDYYTVSSKTIANMSNDIQLYIYA